MALSPQSSSFEWPDSRPPNPRQMLCSQSCLRSLTLWIWVEAASQSRQAQVTSTRFSCHLMIERFEMQWKRQKVQRIVSIWLIGLGYMPCDSSALFKASSHYIEEVFCALWHRQRVNLNSQRSNLLVSSNCRRVFTPRATNTTVRCTSAIYLFFGVTATWRHS